MIPFKNTSLNCNPQGIHCRVKNFLVMKFVFKRYLLSVFFISYFPAQIMVIIGGLASFVHPSAVSARVGLGITTILTVSTLVQGIKNKAPPVAYMTAMDVYLWVCFLFVASSLTEFIYLSFTLMRSKALTKTATPEISKDRAIYNIRVERAKFNRYKSLMPVSHLECARNSAESMKTIRFTLPKNVHITTNNAMLRDDEEQETEESPVREGGNDLEKQRRLKRRTFFSLKRLKFT